MGEIRELIAENECLRAEIERLTHNLRIAKANYAGAEAEIERLKALLKVAKCPSGCEDGVIVHGAVPHEYGEIEYDIEQCQWCDEVAALEGDDE
jgi:hypothetical protein